MIPAFFHSIVTSFLLPLAREGKPLTSCAAATLPATQGIVTAHRTRENERC